MTFLDGFIKLKADLQSIPIDFGLLQYRQLYIRRSFVPQGSTFPQTYDIPLNPNPHITNVSPRLVGLSFSNNSVFVSEDDYLVKDIPRSYSYDFLRNRVEFYILDPIFNEDKRVIGGIKCKPIHISDKKTLTWEIILQKLHDKDPIQPVEVKEE